MPGSVVFLKQVPWALCAIISYSKEEMCIIIAVEEDSLQVETDAGHSWCWQTSCTDLQTTSKWGSFFFFFFLVLFLFPDYLKHTTCQRQIKWRHRTRTTTCGWAESLCCCLFFLPLLLFLSSSALPLPLPPRAACRKNICHMYYEWSVPRQRQQDLELWQMRSMLMAAAKCFCFVCRIPCTIVAAVEGYMSLGTEFFT